MAYEIPLLPFTLPAAADLTARQFHFVDVNNVGKAALVGTAGARCVGILQNDPNTDEAAAIEPFGISICVAGAAVTAGDNITSDNQGRAITAAATNAIHGIALDDAANAGERITVLLRPLGEAES